MSQEKKYTPALGNATFTPLYDIAIAVLTRENTWRSALLDHIAPGPADRIVDVGCGTGSLAIRMKQLSPATEVHGIDPDNKILKTAQQKATSKSADISFHHGFLNAERAFELGKFSKVVSSLVFHQTPIEEKRSILMAMGGLLEPNGKLFVADYGLQRTKLMQVLFRNTVQAIDGIEDTQHNADGCMPSLIREAGFRDVIEAQVVATSTGTISIYTASAGKTTLSRWPASVQLMGKCKKTVNQNL